MANILFGREICGDYETAVKREWLITNGIGGYASGTIPNVLTRRYHGLLMAALQPPLGRTLLIAKLDEEVEYDGIYPNSGRITPLHTNAWASGNIEPNGYAQLNQFHLEGTTPVWTFAIANALLEKRIWMQQGENTTYVNYKLTQATGPLTFEIKALVNYRNYHETTIVNEWQPEATAVSDGLQIRMFEDATPYYIRSQKAIFEVRNDWHEDFHLQCEEHRGQADIQEDHFYTAKITATLNKGESLTIVLSTEEEAGLDGEKALSERQTYERELIDKLGGDDPIAQQLALAADQFIVHRQTKQQPNGRSILSGYHWFSDWGRDTMAALPGLTLATGRPQVAADIIRTYAQFVNQGMIPNRFPDEREWPEYNTVDASLWYIEAIRHYVDLTDDATLLKEIFPTLQKIIQWYTRGTRYNIHMDEEDGLLYAGEAGFQLTWMDAKIDYWVVTHRIGKPVEVNALWYNALHTMADFAKKLGENADDYSQLAEKVAVGYGRFWNEEFGYCYDVIDGPDGDPNGCDSRLRPNQLLAISLSNPLLTEQQQQYIVDACARHLLTPHGLRSLSPDDDEYVGSYSGDAKKRDGAYHQGTVWAWWIGPFVEAHLRVYNDRVQACSFLQPLCHHLSNYGIGTISEIFDGDPPFTPRGCIAQAWSVAELLRVWQLVQD